MAGVATVYPINTLITAKEKRYKPVKHYVFIVEVKWSDNSKIPIYRRYGDFAKLHNDMSDYVASMEGREVKLPQFPANKSFQRNEIQKNATVRRHTLDDYCNSLLDMNTDISQNKILVDFFKSRPEDRKPLEKQEQPKQRNSLLQTLSDLFDSDKKTNKNKAAQNGEEEEIMDISAPIVCETYIVVADYKPEEKREIKLTEGNTVEVVEKYDNGWWFVQTEYGVGWAPATYLTPSDPSTVAEPEPLLTGYKFITIDSYTADQEDEVSFNSGVLVKVLHKLLDGWWIIDYQGQVGYAPATLLQQYNNPHYKGTIKIKGTTKRQRYTQRRSSVKNSKGKTLPERKPRDLTLYRKYSKKIDQEEEKRAAALKKVREGQKNNSNSDDATYVDSSVVQMRKKQGTIMEDVIAETEEDSFVNIPSAIDIDGSPVYNETLPHQHQQPTTTHKAVDHDYEYVEEGDMEEIQNWISEKGFRGRNEAPISVNSGRKSPNLNNGSETPVFNKAPPSPRFNRKSPGLVLDMKSTPQPVTSPGSKLRRGSDNSEVNSHAMAHVQLQAELDQFRPRSSSEISSRYQKYKKQIKPASRSSSSTASSNESLESPSTIAFNKAPPSPNTIRKNLSSSSLSNQATPGMAYVFAPVGSSPRKPSTPSQPKIIINDTTLQDSGDTPIEELNTITSVNANGLIFRSRTPTPPASESNSRPESPKLIFLNKSPKPKKKKSPAREANNNNNAAVTVADVMSMLVSALQSGAISGMRTNAQGEMVLTFGNKQQQRAQEEEEEDEEEEEIDEDTLAASAV